MSLLCNLKEKSTEIIRFVKLYFIKKIVAIFNEKKPFYNKQITAYFSIHIIH